MRVLHWAFPFTLGKGGQSVFIERMSLEFSRLGHVVAILTSEITPSETTKVNLHFENLVEVFQLPSKESPFGINSHTFSQFKYVFDQFAPDVIHIHNLESPMLIYLRSYLNMKTVRPKVIITVHDLSTLRWLRKLKEAKQLNSYFDSIVFPSKYIQKSFEPYELEDRPIFRTIYNGVPLNKNLESRAKNNPQLLFAADLQEHKGGILLLSAWEKIFREFPKVMLKIAGDGPTRKFLEQYSKSMQFKDQVRFYGWLTQEELNLEFASDCVLVIPSVVGEAFGLIGAEASMAGVPIIAHRIGALTEIVVDNLTGMTVTPGDTFELAAKIRGLLLDEDLRRSMGEAGQKRAIENFELTESVKSYEDLFRSIVSQRDV